VIRGTTRVIAILGDPVEHSRSPAMHNAAFAALGLDYVYVALRVAPADLRKAVLGVRALGFAGLNVTVPYKQAIIPFLDRLSPGARAIGAVNTVVREGRQLVGHNTDAAGFGRALSRLRFRVNGRRAVVLGAGGSARAVVHALLDGGIRHVTIFNRDVRRAVDLASALGGRRAAPIDVRPLALAAREEFMTGADIVINCTSLGLDGRGGPRAALAATPRHCLVYDLIYRARPTPLVEKARRLGRRGENGHQMLVQQAALAFRLWTRRKPNVEVMVGALSG